MEQELLKLILKETREMKGDISEIKERLTNVEQDVKELKVRMTNVERDVKELKVRMTNVERDVKELKVRMTNVERDVKELKVRMTNVEKDVKVTKELAEYNKENIESIQRVVTSHYQEFKKFVKSNATQHNLYDAKLLQY